METGVPSSHTRFPQHLPVLASPLYLRSLEESLLLRLMEQLEVGVGVEDWVGLRYVIWIVGDTIQLEIAVSQTRLSLYDDGDESGRSLENH